MQQISKKIIKRSHKK